MKTVNDYIKDFGVMIKDYNKKQQSFLINVLRDMFGTISPSFVTNGKQFYGDFKLDNLVNIDKNGEATFTGYHNPDGKRVVKVNFVDKNVYVSNYEVDLKNNVGKYLKDITRYPMKYDNEKFNALIYNGYLDNLSSTTTNAQLMENIDSDMMDGIQNGRPVSLYRSHSYIILGKVEDKYKYGIFITPEGEKSPIFKEFNDWSDNEISMQDGKELLDFLYIGDVPKDNILDFDNQLQEQDENEKI